MTSRVCLTLLTIFLATVNLPAQTTSVSGIVQDQAGAAMPDVTVTLSKGPQTLTALTRFDGVFTFSGLSVGNYEIRVEKDGFKAATSRISVTNRPVRPLQFKLQIATLQQEVTVLGDEAVLSTESDANRDVASLDRNALDTLPMFDQDYIGTISRFLDAGAMGSGGATLIMDGVQVNSVALPSSAIQEVRINQNPYSPEYLRPGRARIEVVTKPGASAYHGALNFVFRDNRFNAREPFALTRPAEQRRILESSVTGPLGSGKRSSFLIAGSYQSESAEAIVFAVGPQGVIHDNVPTPQRNAVASARLSHQFGERNTVSLRFESQDQYTKNQGVGGTSLRESARNFRHREDAFFYSQTTAFTPKLVNEFGILFGKEYEPQRSVLTAPRTVVLDAFTGGGAQADRLITEYHTSFHDALSWSHGKHTVRMGVDVPDISRRGLEDAANFLGTYTFATLDDFRLQRPLSFVQQRGDGKVIFWEKVLAGFVVDDIRVRPDLSISVAARYDWQNYFHDANNLSPRVAFAFSPRHLSNTVIRGGAGFFYDRSGAQPIYDLLRYDGNHLFQYVVTQGEVRSPQPSIVKLAPQIGIPYLLQFGIGVERQLRKGTTLTLNYIGNDTVGAFRSRDVNAPLPPLYADRPNANYSVIRQIESSGRAKSNSLEIALRGNVTRFFSGLMQYSISRSLNNTTGIASFPANNYDLSGEWGRADFDQRHRFNLLGTLKKGKWANLGIGTQLNSGRPYSQTTGRDDFHTGNAIARPQGVERNTLEGPGYGGLDLRWFHDFRLAQPIHEVPPTLTLALDGFNVTNRVNYNGYVGNLSSPLYGKAVGAAPPRRLQLSARFAF